MSLWIVHSSSDADYLSLLQAFWGNKQGKEINPHCLKSFLSYKPLCLLPKVVRSSMLVTRIQFFCSNSSSIIYSSLWNSYLALSKTRMHPSRRVYVKGAKLGNMWAWGERHRNQELWKTYQNLNIVQSPWPQIKLREMHLSPLKMQDTSWLPMFL